jgi:hypothetical protein
MRNRRAPERSCNLCQAAGRKERSAANRYGVAGGKRNQTGTVLEIRSSRLEAGKKGAGIVAGERRERPGTLVSNLGLEIAASVIISQVRN